MVANNALIVDRPPSAAAEEKTTNVLSPPSQIVQKSDIQEINDDIHQTHKLYHFQNCGIVYMNSFNARGVRMENCGNHVPQVTCSFFFPRFFSITHVLV